MSNLVNTIRNKKIPGKIAWDFNIVLKVLDLHF